MRIFSETIGTEKKPLLFERYCTSILPRLPFRVA